MMTKVVETSSLAVLMDALMDAALSARHSVADIQQIHFDFSPRDRNIIFFPFLFVIFLRIPHTHIHTERVSHDEWPRNSEGIIS